MPVSSPSYFPPARSDGSVIGQTAGTQSTGDRLFLAGQSAGGVGTINDLIVVGYQALDAGVTATPLSDTDLAGTIVIGNGAASALTVASNSLDPNTDKPDVIVGYQAAAVAANIGAAVIIGASAFASYVGSASDANGRSGGNVIVGTEAVQNMNGTLGLGQAPVNNVVIGSRALRGQNSGYYARQSVVIGSEAADQIGEQTNSGHMNGNVIIGYRAGQLQSFNSTVGTETVIIGRECLLTGNTQRCVYIGADITGADGIGQTPNLHNVIIGWNVTNAGGSASVVIGGVAKGSTGARNVIIGRSAGQAESTTNFNARLIVEANDGVDAVAMFWGDMATGNLLVGNSLDDTTAREFSGSASRNILKLMNGVIGTTNPVGGGYFYSAAAANAALHWVQSDGTDTVLAGGGGGSLAGRGAFTAAAGANNNVTPDSAVNIQSINRLFVDTTAGAANITGISAGYNGQMLWVNVSGGNALTLNSENAGSTAANRLSGSADLVFASGDNTLLVYDDTIDRWMMGV